VRVLLACRDAGAALHLLAVARALREGSPAGAAPLHVLVEGPARLVFEGAGLPATVLGAEDTTRIAEQCRLFQPQVVLTGVSAPGPTIEESVTRVAQEQSVPVLALQDYWGCGHDDRQVVPDGWLVLDDEAARLTRAQYPLAACDVVGSPRHDTLVQRDLAALQQEANRRRRHGAPPVVMVAGQPLWHLPAYASTLHAAALALRSVSHAVRLRYAPHPAEGDVRTRVEQLFATHSLAVEVRAMTDLVADLCDADVLLTAFSTCVWDLLQLHRHAPTPMAVPLCLLFEPALRAAHARHAGGLAAPPYAPLLGDLVVTSREALKQRIESALDGATRSEVTSRVQAALPPQHASAAAQVLASLRRAALSS
jgi:hypothetical protein